MKRNHSGFTLVELLISMLILSLLLYTGYFSYSLYSSSWSRYQGSLEKQQSRYMNLQMLDRLLKGIMPWPIENRANRGGFLFEGDQNSLLSVSREGLYSKGEPEIFRLTLQPQTDQTYNLVYQSVSSQVSNIVHADQEITFENSYLLLKGIQQFRVEYSGYENLAKKGAISTTKPETQNWSVFSGTERQLIPEKLSLHLMFEDGEVSLTARFPNRPEKLLSSYISDDL